MVFVNILILFGNRLIVLRVISIESRDMNILKVYIDILKNIDNVMKPINSITVFS